VVSDDAMIDLARRLPRSLEAMEQLRSWKGSLKKYADEIAELIEQSSQLPEDQWPVIEHSVVLSVKQDALVDFLMGIVRLRAIANDVTPAVLTTRKELERLVLHHDDVSVLKGWRFELVGNDLKQFMDGKKTIRINRDEINLESQ